MHRPLTTCAALDNSEHGPVEPDTLGTTRVRKGFAAQQQAKAKVGGRKVQARMARMAMRIHKLTAWMPMAMGTPLAKTR